MLIWAPTDDDPYFNAMAVGDDDDTPLEKAQRENRRALKTLKEVEERKNACLAKGGTCSSAVHMYEACKHEYDSSAARVAIMEHEHARHSLEAKEKAFRECMSKGNYVHCAAAWLAAERARDIFSEQK